MSERTEVPYCDKCTAFEENTDKKYVEKEICPVCPWSREIKEPVIYKFLDYLALVDAGCPVGRHELTNTQWHAIGVLKQEREKIAVEKAKKKER